MTDTAYSAPPPLTPATSAQRAQLPLIWRVLAFLVRVLSPQHAGLLLCVAIPTLVTLGYQTLLAADLFVSESAFSVRMDNATSGLSEAGVMFAGLQIGSGSHDQLAVNTYIHSQAMIEHLEKSVGLRAMFRHPNADRFSRLPDNATAEEVLDYYQRRVAIHYDDRGQISVLKVRAFTAADAKRLNEAILEAAELFVNQLSASIRKDSVAFAQEQVGLAEQGLIDATRILGTFREQNHNFDPARTSEGIGAILQGLQGKLSEKRAALDIARGTMTPQNPYVHTLTREIAALERQIAAQTETLTGDDPQAIGKKLESYSTLALRHQFAMKRYEMAMTALEAAQAEAGRKSIYLTRVVPPPLPDEATEPRRGYTVLSVLFISLAAYAMLVLIAASVYDHLRQ